RTQRATVTAPFAAGVEGEPRTGPRPTATPRRQTAAQCGTRTPPSLSRFFRRRAWMISSMTMTATLNSVTMVIDSQIVIGVLLADRHGLRLLHQRASRGAVRLAEDEARAEVRDHDRQERLRGGEADEHPDRQETSHDRVEPDV